jgi:hypothetical protein
MGQSISYLHTSRKPMTQLGEVLYNILLEFGIPKKLVRLIKMCLNETYRKICVDEHLSDTFLPETGRCSIANSLQFCLRICHQESPRKSRWSEIEWDTSATVLC